APLPAGVASVGVSPPEVTEGSDSNGITNLLQRGRGDLTGLLGAQLQDLGDSLRLLRQMRPALVQRQEDGIEVAQEHRLAVDAPDPGPPALQSGGILSGLRRKGLVQGEDRADVRVAGIASPDPGRIG